MAAVGQSQSNQPPDGALGPESSYAIEARGISKRFAAHGTQALNDVSFWVPEKKVFTILGPNGAGKTTLIRILTTLMRPAEGDATVAGFHIPQDSLKAREHIGIVFQENHFNTYMTMWDNLLLHCRMHGMDSEDAKAQIEHWLKRIDLWDRRHHLTDTLSGGMQRRVALVRALLHRPTLLFLDEPTTGLDPNVRREMWDAIALMRDHATIVLTTHYMEEADVLSDEILILHRGQVMMQGSPAEVKRRMHVGFDYELVLNTPMAAQYEATLHGLGLSPDQVGVVDDFTLQFSLNDCQGLPPIAAAVAPEDWRMLGRRETDLESIFIQLAQSGRDSGGQEGGWDGNQGETGSDGPEGGLGP